LDFNTVFVTPKPEKVPFGVSQKEDEMKEKRGQDSEMMSTSPGKGRLQMAGVLKRFLGHWGGKPL